MILLLFILSTYSFAQSIKKGSVIDGVSFDFSTKKITNSDLKVHHFQCYLGQVMQSWMIF